MTTRIALTSGELDGSPETYQVVYHAFEYETPDQAHDSGLREIEKLFSGSEKEVAGKNLLVMYPEIARAIYPCAEPFVLMKSPRL